MSDTLGGIKTREHCEGISVTIFKKPSGGENEYYGKTSRRET